MDVGDQRQDGREHRERNDVAGAVDRGAQLRFRHAPDHVVVDRDLAEGAEHEAQRHDERRPVGQAGHHEEEDDLDHRDAREDEAGAVAVEQVADDELRHRGDGEDDEGKPADQGRALADADEAFLEDLRQGEGGALEDDAGDGGGEEDDRRDADEHGAPFGRRGVLVRRCGPARVGVPGAGGVPGREAVGEMPGIGDADDDGDDARYPEGRAPAGGVDQGARQERRAADAEVAPYAVHRDVAAHARAAASDHGKADGMVDRREDADGEQAGRDLERTRGERRGDRGKPGSNEEDRHHAFPAPAVRKPAGGERKETEGDEARCRIGHELGIRHPPLADQREGGDGREDQHEEVVQEVAHVQEEEMEAIFHGGLNVSSELVQTSLARGTALGQAR